jgi:hypothetical protein
LKNATVKGRGIFILTLTGQKQKSAKNFKSAGIAAFVSNRLSLFELGLQVRGPIIKFLNFLKKVEFCIDEVARNGNNSL